MPIDRGSRRSRRFHPYPQLPRPLHTRVSRLSRLSRDRPTVVGGMWRLRAATSAAPAGLRWVKSSGLLQNNVENLWLFRMKHDRWLGVHIELQEGWDQNDHGKKWIFHGQMISGCSNNAVDHWPPDNGTPKGCGGSRRTTPRPKGGTPPHKSLSKTSLSPTTTNTVLWHSMMHIQARKTACVWREIISVYKIL